MSVSEFRSRLQFTFPYRNVFQSVLSQFPLSYYNLRPLLGVLYRFAQYEIFLILQFAFQQQSVLKSKTMMNNEAITIHVPTQKRYNRCYFEVCFNSRSHVVSVIIDVYYQINVLELQFTLPRRERPSNQLLKSREEVLQFTLLRRACHNPKMCNTICIDYNSLFYKEESKPSIRDVGPCYCNSRSHIGSADDREAVKIALVEFQFTLPYRERRYTKNWDLPLWILQFTLPYRERHSPDCNGTKTIDYNSRSHIGSAAILGFNSGSISELQFTLPYRERRSFNCRRRTQFTFQFTLPYRERRQYID